MTPKIYIPSPRYAEIVGGDTAYYTSDTKTIKEAYCEIVEAFDTGRKPEKYPLGIKPGKKYEILRPMFSESPVFSEGCMYGLKVDSDSVVSVVDADTMLGMIVCGNVEEKPC